MYIVYAGVTIVAKLNVSYCSLLQYIVYLSRGTYFVVYIPLEKLMVCLDL